MLPVVPPQMALRHNTPNVPNHRSHARIGIHNPNPGPGMICGKYPEHLIRKSLPDLPDAVPLQLDAVGSKLHPICHTGSEEDALAGVRLGHGPGWATGPESLDGLQLSSNKQV